MYRVKNFLKGAVIWWCDLVVRLFDPIIRGVLKAFDDV